MINNPTANPEVAGLKKSRDFNPDIIRIIAFLFVPSAHFLLNTEFYSIPMTNPLHIAIMCFRNICLCAVPLFMILTGYLQITKDFTPNKKYYGKILKFLIPYFISCILILVVDILLKRSSFSILNTIKGLTTFTGYSWYVEMYLGVFLLIPFLNKFYSTLTTKKQEKIFLGILIALTLLPTIINNYSFTSGTLFFYPADSEQRLKLIPDFYTILYPFTFYFTGAYIRKHKDEFKLSASKRFLLLVAVFSVFCLYNIIRNYGYTPNVYNWVGRSSITVYVTALLIFMFLIAVDFSKVPQKVSKFIAKIADLTFSAYLCSYVVDTIVYRYFNRWVSGFNNKLLLYPAVVLLVAVISLICAFFVNFVTTKICRFADKKFFNPTQKLK